MTVEPPGWHLDRQLSIGLIGAIILQTVGVVWWAASLSASVAELRATNDKQDQSIAATAIVREANRNRVTTLEVQTESITRQLGRIEDKLDKLTEFKSQRP